MTHTLPDRHLVTAMQDNGATFTIAGYHAHNGIALFDISVTNDGHTDTLYEMVPWPVAFKFVAQRFGLSLAGAERLLRSVLPDA